MSLTSPSDQPEQTEPPTAIIYLPRRDAPMKTRLLTCLLAHLHKDLKPLRPLQADDADLFYSDTPKIIHQIDLDPESSDAYDHRLFDISKLHFIEINITAWKESDGYMMEASARCADSKGRTISYMWEDLDVSLKPPVVELVDNLSWNGILRRFRDFAKSHFNEFGEEIGLQAEAERTSIPS
jgi:hypothetical protein